MVLFVLVCYCKLLYRSIAFTDKRCVLSRRCDGQNLGTDQQFRRFELILRIRQSFCSIIETASQFTTYELLAHITNELH